LKKLSIQEQVQYSEYVETLMSVKNPVLKKGQKLDLRPFSEVLTTEDTDQKVKVLVFWSVYCPPCLESFQHLSEIFKQVKNPDELLVLAITGNNPQEARRKLEEKPLLYAKLISNGGTILNHYQ
jgi:protein-disulfide isomerase